VCVCECVCVYDIVAESRGLGNQKVEHGPAARLQEIFAPGG